MDRKQVILSYQEEVTKLRRKLNQLELNSVEQRASDEVSKWRQTFDTSSSSEMERMLNGMEKRKQSEVSHLANELRTSLNEFKEANLSRLAQLDAFISKMNIDDDIQFEFVKFELNTITKEIASLHVDIVVKVVDRSQRRRSSTSLARNALELAKVFEFKDLEAAPNPTSSYLESLTNFVSGASTMDAGYYNVDVIDPQIF